MRKDILNGKLARLANKKDELKKRAAASEDVAEVRAIQTQLEEINAEIDETNAELSAIN